MKIKGFILFLSFSLLPDCMAYAGNENLNVSYPAPSGSYNKLVLQSLTAAPSCSSGNVGLLYMDPTTNSLQMCACTTTGSIVSCSAVKVKYPESCFNRFCSWTDNTQNPASRTLYCSLNGCPRGYTWTIVNSISDEDVMTTYYDSLSGLYYHTQSSVCCSANATITNPPAT